MCYLTAFTGSIFKFKFSRFHFEVIFVTARPSHLREARKSLEKYNEVSQGGVGGVY